MISRTLVAGLLGAGCGWIALNAGFGGASVDMIEGEDGLATGPMTMRVELPQGKIGKAEPLLSFGKPGNGDIVFLQYLAADAVAVGWERTGFGAVFSDPLDLGKATSHEISIALGSWQKEAAASPNPCSPSQPNRILEEAVVVSWNQRVVLRMRSQPDPASVGGRLFFGRNGVGGSIAGAHFSGRIAHVRPWSAEEVLETMGSRFPGPMRLLIRFPSHRPGHSEPLVVTGPNGAADIVYVSYLDDGRMRFGFDHWGVGGRLSEPFEMDPDRVYELLVGLGSMLPPVVDGSVDFYAPLRDRCLLVLDGKVALDLPVECFPASPEQINVGTNVIGASSCDPVFSGMILSANPADAARIARMIDPSLATPEGLITFDGCSFPGPLRLRLRFAAGRAGSGEPLVATGRTGAGDLIFVRYEGGNRLRIGLDHWGNPEQMSESLEIDLARTHELIVSMSSLLPSIADGGQDAYRALRERCVVMLDGQVVLDRPSSSFANEPTQIRIGANTIGASTAGKSFTEQIVTVERATVAEIIGRLD